MGRLILSQVAPILILLVSPSGQVWAGEFEQHPGYLSDTSGERYQVSREVVIVPPESKSETSLRDKIFAEKLTKEFTQRYEERFGRTRAEQIFSTPSQFFETEVQPGIFRTADEDAQEQKDFGSFMLKRTVEYHIDRWMKESPSARPVYELKERISNVNVEVRPGYKLRFKYSLSSNDMDIYLKNPYSIENRLRLRMGSGFGPSDVKQTVVYLGYPVTKKVRMRTDYTVENQDYNVSAIRQLGNRWSTSVTGGETVSTGERVLVGLGWRD